ncbi:MAG: hypothetical protein ACRENI_13310 [Gemmatimonadaceae bacterium]
MRAAIAYGCFFIAAAGPAVTPTAAQDSAPAAAVVADRAGGNSSVARTRAELAARVRVIERHPEGLDLPETDSIAIGGLTVAAGARASGPVAAYGGPLDIHGTVDGDAVAIDADVIVREGGRVTGNAVAIGGVVRTEGDGALVGGEMRSMNEMTAIGASAGASPIADSWRAVAIALAWLALLALIGIGVLMFAGPHLDGVTDALEDHYGRSLLFGIVAQLAIVPLLALLVVGLAITILGILLIPFGVVAFLLALAGLLTLGFLAVARVTGTALMRRERLRSGPERGVALRALMLGLAAFFSLWFVAALFTWAPMAGAVLRGVAIIITWVAVTAGLGATVMSRAGTRREDPAPEPEPDLSGSEFAWQTPTPVAGVVAARRPTPVTRGADPS